MEDLRHERSRCQTLRRWHEGLHVSGTAPDGKRLLMMRFRQRQAPEPMIFNLEQTEGKVVTTVPGLWASPAWR